MTCRGSNATTWRSSPGTVAPSSVVDKRRRAGHLRHAERQAARAVISAVEEGIGQVRAVVPYDWDGQRRGLRLSDTDLLAGLDDLPAADPDSLDAVSFAVPAGSTARTGAAGKHALPAAPADARQRPPAARPADPARAHPRRPRQPRRRRTDLARRGHRRMGLGPAAARGPAPDQPDGDRRGRGGPDELPADLDYNDEDQAAHYGISWWACEAIVDMYGEPMLWRLLDELAATSPTTRPTSCSRPCRWARGSWPARRRDGSWRRTDDSRVAPRAGLGCWDEPDADQVDRALVADTEDPDFKLKKSLSALDLTVFGIGVIIGAGIFTLTGRVAQAYAGPAWCSRSRSPRSAVRWPPSATPSSPRRCRSPARPTRSPTPPWASSSPGSSAGT